MGKVIPGDFGRRRALKEAEAAKTSSEPALYKLSPQERLETAIEREVLLKEAGDKFGKSEIDMTEFKQYLGASLRISGLLTSEQKNEAKIAAQNIYEGKID